MPTDHDPSPETSRVLQHRSNPLTHPHVDYPAALVGTTPHFSIYSATALGALGVAVAQDALQRCEADYDKLRRMFAIEAAPFNIIVSPLSAGNDGTGGAYHHTCLSTDLYCDVQFSPLNPALTSALIIAKEVEVFEAAQARGWECGGSNGEGLSRVLAEVLYPGTLDDYSTAADWLDSSRPDWVSQTNPTDTDPNSNGCAVLFLYWLNVQLGFGWDAICRAAAPTLEKTYTLLTGNTDGYTAFRALLDQFFPPGVPSGLRTDNPFPL
jgi:hypothetical protein